MLDDSGRSESEVATAGEVVRGNEVIRLDVVSDDELEVNDDDDNAELATDEESVVAVGGIDDDMAKVMRLLSEYVAGLNVEDVRVVVFPVIFMASGDTGIEWTDSGVSVSLVTTLDVDVRGID